MTNALKSKIAKAGLGLVAAASLLVGAVQVSAYTFTAPNMKLGSSGAQVMELQKFLNMDADTKLAVAAGSAGSAGYETMKFGPATKAAVIKYQVKHGIVPASGLVGPLTRASMNAGGGSTGGTLPAGCTSTSGFSPLTGMPCSGGSGTVVTTGAVSVALATDNPTPGTLLTDNTTGVMENAHAVMKLTFSNGTSAAVNVNTLKLTRTGIATDGDVNNMFLYDGMTKVAELASVSNRVFSFNNSSGLFSVPANGTKTVWVGVNVAANSTGTTLGFKVASAADVTLAGGAAAGGSFPIMGNEFSIADVTDLGYVNLTSTTTFPATIDPSSTSQELWRFTATANDQKMAVEKIVLTMVGTIQPADIQDLMLTVGGVQVGATAQIGSDNKVVFDWSGTPYQILSGQNKVFVLMGKVVRGTGRAFKFTIRSTADFVAHDMNYDVDTVPLSGGSALTVVDPDSSGDGTNINNGTLTVSRSASAPTGNVVSGGLDVPLARFDFKANGEDIKVTTLGVTVNNSQNTTMNDGKLYFNGSQVGTTDDSVADNTENDFSLGNTVIIPAGTTGVFEYRANIEDASGTDLTAAGTIVVSLSSGTTDAQGMTSLTNIAMSAATANTLTIQTGTLSVAKTSTFNGGSSTNPTGVNGATGVKVGSLTISAGSGEGATVTQIVVGDDSGDATEDFGDNFQNLTLKHDGAAIASTQGTLSGTAGADYTFNLTPSITIAAGTQYVVDIYADILTGAAGYGGARVGLEFVSVSASGVVTSTDASYSTATDLQNIYRASAGTLTVTVDSDTPVAAQYVMGATDQTVGKFKFAASTSEAITLQKIIVGMNDGDSSDDEAAVRGDFGNFKLYNGATLVASAASASSDDNDTEDIDGLITFDGLTLNVAAGSSVVLTLKADVSTYPNATSGDAVVFGIYNDGSTELPTAVTAIGAGSGSDLSTDAASDQNANAATVYRTKLTVAYASDSPSGASSGATDQVVAKYVVSNSSNVGNYDATLKLFGQNISSTIALTAETDRNVKIYKDSITSGNLLATVTYDTRNTNTCSPADVSGTTPGTACIDAGDSGDVTEDRYGATNADTTTGLTAAKFLDVTIAAGTSKTIIVTADTLDAASAKNFSVQPISTGAATSIVWSDGITASILTIDSLPLVPVRTLTY